MILTNKKSINAGPSFGTGEGVAHSKRWYVALVRMHHEKKVSEYLDKMGIENFIPLQQEMHQWSDRRKLIESVLLPMMVFVHADPKERGGSSELVYSESLYGDAWRKQSCRHT